MGRALSKREIQDRRQRAKFLRSEGYSFRAIADVLHVSRSQAYKDCEAPVSTFVLPASPGPAAGEPIDWPAVENATVQLLQYQAENGSVPASRELVKLSRDEATKMILSRCENHSTTEEVYDAIRGLWDVFMAQVRDRFPRELSQALGVSQGDVERMLGERLNDVYIMVSGLKETEQEQNQGGQ